MRRVLLLALLWSGIASAQMQGGIMESQRFPGGAQSAQQGAANLRTSYVLCQSSVAVTSAIDANENTLYTCVVPAVAIGPNGALRIAFAAAHTSSVNNKTYRIRFSGAAGTIVSSAILTTQSPLSSRVNIYNRNAANSQMTETSYTASNSLSAADLIPSAIDTTAATSVVVTCQKATAAETCRLDTILIEVIYGA